LIHSHGTSFWVLSHRRSPGGMVKFHLPPPDQAAFPFAISTGGIIDHRPTQGDEKRLLEAQSLSLVIPTGAQRSGGTCGLADLSWK
jgi:hypothetical protein